MKISMNIMRWPVLLLAATFAVACGSSGNGGDVVEDDVIVLPVYEYQLTSTTDDPITVSVAGTPLTVTIGHLFEGPGLFGEYSPETGDFSVFSGSSLTIEESGPLFANEAPAELITLFGDFSVEATADWTVPADSDPESGTLVVTRGKERIEVAVINNGTAVRVSWDAAGDGVYEESAEFTWNEFDDLEDDPAATEWQLLGNFAYDGTIEFMFELAQVGIEAFDFIDEDLAQTGGQVVVLCDAFSDLGLSVPPAPPTFPDQGALTFSWIDDGSDGGTGPDGAVGVGDSFVMAFDYCLEIDPDDDIEELVNGEVGLNSLTEAYEQRTAGETLVRIGWEGPGVAERPGGIEFRELEEWEIFDADGDGAGTVAAAELVSVIDGRMTLVFFEP